MIKIRYKYLPFSMSSAMEDATIDFFTERLAFQTLQGWGGWAAIFHFFSNTLSRISLDFALHLQFELSTFKLYFLHLIHENCPF